ncbi:MAG: hypothetical protein ABI678_08545 [Kofleriaceae bacterium]
MKHLAFVAALAATVPGCATTTGKVSGGVAIASTALALAAASPGQSCPNEECDLGKVIGTTFFLGIAVLAGGIALVAEARHHEPPPTALVPASHAPTRSPPGVALAAPTTRAPDPRVIELGTSASIEASLGRCSAASILGDRVRDLDAQYYRAILLSDRAFASCK